MKGVERERRRCLMRRPFYAERSGGKTAFDPGDGALGLLIVGRGRGSNSMAGRNEIIFTRTRSQLPDNFTLVREARS